MAVNITAFLEQPLCIQLFIQRLYFGFCSLNCISGISYMIFKIFIIQ